MVKVQSEQEYSLLGVLVAAASLPVLFFFLSLPKGSSDRFGLFT